MGVYECFFSTAEPQDMGWFVNQICSGNYYLSYGFFLQLSDLESFDADSDWSRIVVTKKDIENLKCDDFNEDDWWFIRTLYDCFEIFDIIYVELWYHIYIYVKK